jgi:DNA repair protein RecN (Recombination protein N)
VVAKSKSAGAARTTVAVLDEAGRVEEIARMLGGLTVTERARAHAREMLQPKARRRTG